MSKTRIVSSSAACLAFAALLLGTAPAHAIVQDANPVAMLNHEALEQYDLLEFDRAKKTLTGALKLAEEKSMLEDKNVARTQMLMAAVLAEGYKDPKAAAEWMRKALRTDPELKLPVNVTAKGVQKIYGQIVAEAAAEKAAFDAKLAKEKKEREERQAAEKARVEKMLAEKAAKRANEMEKARKAGEAAIAEAREAQTPTASEPKKSAAKATLVEDVEPESVEGLKCPSPAELPARRPLAVRCALEKAIEAQAVFAFYRQAGKEDFTPQILKKSPKGWWEAILPPEIVSGSAIEIYFEARDKKGRALAGDGNQTEPKQLQIKQSGMALRGPRTMATSASVADTE